MIKRIRIQNFRSIRDVTVDLSPVTVLVGRSGTGKSAFVEAIRLLREFVNGRDVASRVAISRPAAIKPAPAARFEIDFTINGIPDGFHYTIEISNNGKSINEEQLRLGDRTLYSQTALKGISKWEIEPPLVNLPAPGSLAINRLPSLSDVVIAYSALSGGIGCYVFNESTLTGSDPNATGLRGLNDDARNYLQVLKDLASNLQDLGLRKKIISALKRVNSSVSAVELDDILKPQKVIVGHLIGQKTLELELPRESDGLRRIYAYLLALYQLPPKQTLIFEHPEDGIHPGALAVLAEEFKAAPDDNRGQVVLTTHSPLLLNHFSADQIRVVEIEDFETRIGPISAEQKEAITEGLLESGELLTVDPARIALESAGA